MNGLRSTARKVLLGCGIASGVLYVAGDVLMAVWDAGYRYLARPSAN